MFRTLALIIFLLPQSIMAQTASSVADGDWNNSATWSCNCVPGQSDVVIINDQHTISVTDNNRKAGTLLINGTLHIDGNKTIKVYDQLGLAGQISGINCGSLGCGKILVLNAATVTVNQPTISNTQFEVKFSGSHGGTISGSGSIPILTVGKNAELLAGSELTITGELSGLSTLVIDENAHLYFNSPDDISGLELFLRDNAHMHFNSPGNFGGTLTATNPGATVHYGGGFDVAVKQASYRNLRIAVAQTYTAYLDYSNNNLSVLGDLIVENGATFVCANRQGLTKNVTIDGNCIVDGRFEIPEDGRIQSMTNLRVGAGGVFENSNNSDIVINGNFINDGFVFAGDGTYTLNSTNGEISGSGLFGPGLGELSIVLNGVYTNHKQLVVDELSGAGDWIQGDSSRLTLRNEFPNFSGRIDAVTHLNEIRYIGIGGDLTLITDRFQELSINRISGDIIASGSVFIQKALNLINGNLEIGNSTLILMNGASASGEFDSYVSLDDGGTFVQMTQSTGEIEFPIGNENGYSPLTLDLQQASFDGIGSSVFVQLIGTAHPQAVETGSIMNRFWRINSADLSNPQYSVRAEYQENHYIGNENAMLVQLWTGAWNEVGVLVPDSNYLFAENLTQFGDFTTAGTECSSIQSWSTEATTNSVTLNWTIDPSFDHLQIRGRRLGTADWIVLNLPNANDISKGINNLPANQEFEWQVRAFCDEFEVNSSAYSQLDTFNTFCKTSDSVWTHVLGTTVTLNWSAITGARGFQIQGRPLGIGGFTSFTFNDPNAESFTVNNLTPGQGYEWQVRTLCNSSGTLKSPYIEMDTFFIPVNKGFEAADVLEEASPEFSIYPNPSTSTFTISGNLKQFRLVSLVSACGREINSKPRVMNANNGTILDGEGLGKGVYFVKWQSANQSGTLKLIRQ